MKKMILMVAVLTLVAFVTGAFAQQKPAQATTPAPAPAHTLSRLSELR
jgi:hypothetical protein